MSVEMQARHDPELQRLEDLVQAGWRFEHRYDETGHVQQINATRAAGCYVDGLRVRNRSDAAGIRWNRADGSVIWSHDGSLTEVIDALLTLPEPS